MTTQTAPTVEQITTTLEEIVAEFGEDYIYPREIINDVGSCRYMLDGEPSCLIGHLLHRLGVPADPDDECINAFRVVPRHLPDLPEYVYQALDHTQTEQDDGRPWGEALAVYKARLRLESWD